MEAYNCHPLQIQDLFFNSIAYGEYFRLTDAKRGFRAARAIWKRNNAPSSCGIGLSVDLAYPTKAGTIGIASGAFSFVVSFSRRYPYADDSKGAESSNRTREREILVRGDAPYRH